MSNDWKEEYFTMITDCEKRCKGLSDWETKFLASVRLQLTEDARITSTQVTKLEEIWEKATAGG